MVSKPNPTDIKDLWETVAGYGTRNRVGLDVFCSSNAPAPPSPHPWPDAFDSTVFHPSNILFHPRSFSDRFTTVYQNEGDTISINRGCVHSVTGLGLVAFMWNYVNEDMIEDIVSKEFEMADFNRCAKVLTARHALHIKHLRILNDIPLLTCELVKAYARNVYTVERKFVLGRAQQAAKPIQFAFSCSIGTDDFFTSTACSFRGCQICRRPCPLEIFSTGVGLYLCHKCSWYCIRQLNSPCPSRITLMSDQDQYDMLNK